MVKLTDKEYVILNSASDLTGSDYEINEDKDISSEMLINVVTDLMEHYEELKDEFRNFKEYVEDNYKATTMEEQIYG